MKVNILVLDDINVTRVRSTGGLSGAKLAFDKLESKMDTLKGKKMYGCFYTKTNEYFACVQIDKDDMGFEKGIIPGGKYAIKIIDNWTVKIKEIAKIFTELGQDCIKNNVLIDDLRPHIEFYKSFRELIIMLPVK